MRLLAFALLLLIALIQNPLWFGKGGWLRVWQLDRQVAEQREHNARLAARNALLEADVADLKEGLDAVEERARVELGMIRPDEIFFQILEPRRPQADPARD